MRKILIMLSVIVACMCSTFAEASVIDLEDRTVGLLINDEWASPDQPPIIVNDRTLAPLRIVSENLGYEVDWEGDSGKITVSKDDVNIVMHIGSKTIIKNGNAIETDVAPAILNDRTIIPVRVVAELLDCKVEWHPEARMVFVDSPKAYAYYNSLSYKENTYDDSYMELSGYLGHYYIEPDYIISAKRVEKFYLIPDGMCKVIADDGYGNKNTFLNIKKIELEPGVDCSELVGKRVIVKGNIMGVANRDNSMPFRFFADIVEEDADIFAGIDYATAFKKALNTPTSFSGEEVNQAKLVDINKDGVNEMIVLDWSPTMNYVDVLLYSYTPYGAVKETINIGNYSFSGIFSEGLVNMYEHDSFMIIENSVNGVGLTASGEERPKRTVFNKIFIDANGRINKEIAFYEVSENGMLVKNYNESDAKKCSQSEIDVMKENNTKGNKTILFEIVPDYYEGIANISINKAYFDLKYEVEEQLK